MRVLAMIKGSGTDEERTGAETEMFEAMNRYNEALVDAGVMLGGEGLHPTSEGAKVVFTGTGTEVVVGPFTDDREVVAGYWIWQVDSLDEAIEWARRCPSGSAPGASQVLELRPFFEMDEFGDEFPEELRERELRLAERIKEQHG